MKRTIINCMIPIAAGLIVGAAQASDPNGYLKGIEPAEDPNLRRQHTFTAEQIVHCHTFAVAAGFEDVGEIMGKNMRVYQTMAGLSDKESLENVLNASRNVSAMMRGYLAGYKARLLETEGDLSEIDEQFHIDMGRELYRENHCDQWATFILENPEN